MRVYRGPLVCLIGRHTVLAVQYGQLELVKQRRGGVSRVEEEAGGGGGHLVHHQCGWGAVGEEAEVGSSGRHDGR